MFNFEARYQNAAPPQSLTHHIYTSVKCIQNMNSKQKYIKTIASKSITTFTLSIIYTGITIYVKLPLYVLCYDVIAIFIVDLTRKDFFNVVV